MGLLTYFRSVYDLDTLDTRFTTQSKTSYRTVIDSRGEADSSDPAKDRIASKAEPSKWKTPEFLFYGVFVTFCVPYMCWIPYTVSRRMRPLVALRGRTQITDMPSKHLIPNSTNTRNG